MFGFKKNNNNNFYWAVSRKLLALTEWKVTLI